MNDMITIPSTTNIRSALSEVLSYARSIIGSLPRRPVFAAVGSPARRAKYEECQGPNWHSLKRHGQASHRVGSAVQSIGSELMKYVQMRSVIGNWIDYPEVGFGIRFESAEDLAWELCRRYLEVAGAKRINLKALHDVKAELLRQCDATSEYVDYQVYAPIAWLRFRRGGCHLDEVVRIQRISPKRVAQIATSDPRIAGFSAGHRLNLWTNVFLVWSVRIRKRVSGNQLGCDSGTSLYPEIIARLNRETVLMRALLHERITTQQFAILPIARGGQLIHHSHADLPWRFPASPFGSYPNGRWIGRYRRVRRRFLEGENEQGWTDVMASMFRFAMAWDCQSRADVLAGLVAALEQLFVRNDKTEVSYKLRVRAAYYLEKSPGARAQIMHDIKDAYEYRSRIVHGGYVFDHPMNIETARSLGKARQKRGNRYDDVNRVIRLTVALSKYYRGTIGMMIQRRGYAPDWEAVGL